MGERFDPLHQQFRDQLVKGVATRYRPKISDCGGSYPFGHQSEDRGVDGVWEEAC